MSDAAGARDRSMRPYLWVVGLFWMLPAVLTFLLVLLLPHQAAQCQSDVICKVGSAILPATKPQED